MLQHLYFDGKFIPVEAFGLPTHNRAFRYGDRLFETIRVYRGQLLWSEFHYQRLTTSAKMLHMELPGDWTNNLMRSVVDKLCTLNGDALGDFRVRLTLFRDGEGLYTPETHKSAILIEAAPMAPQLYPFNQRGLKVDIFNDCYLPVHPFSKIKGFNAQCSVMASIHSKHNNLDDCIILNDKNKIAEASSSNIFLIFDNTITTPSLDEGCIDGIMRRVFLTMAPKAGYKILETSIEIADLMQADEVMLTNSIGGLRWVEKFRDKTYSCETARVLNGLLLKFAYEQMDET